MPDTLKQNQVERQKPHYRGLTNTGEKRNL